MSNTELVSYIITLTRDMLIYLLPVIGLLSGINFVLSFFMSVTFGLAKRTFKR